MPLSTDILIVGAGPAGLRAAQVLAEAGRQVLVLEKNDEIGPKTCAGGLTVKAWNELVALGLPADAACRSVGHVSFTGGPCRVLDPEGAVVYTIARRELGRIQAGWAARAGATLRVGAAAAELDLPAHTVRVRGELIRWSHLIGADGATSSVRRALGLPCARAYFAGEYNISGLRLEPLRIECDSRALRNGYFWVFPHAHYTSIGAGAPTHAVAPGTVRRYLDRRLERLGVSRDGAPFEGATLEVEHHGFHFPGNVHLAGDAAGTPSALTAEGIYAALVTGEEVARRILDVTAGAPKTERWLARKARHDRAAELLASRPARELVLHGFNAMTRLGPMRRKLTRFFAGV